MRDDNRRQETRQQQAKEGTDSTVRTHHLPIDTDTQRTREPGMRSSLLDQYPVISTHLHVPADAKLPAVAADDDRRTCAVSPGRWQIHCSSNGLAPDTSVVTTATSARDLDNQSGAQVLVTQLGDAVVAQYRSNHDIQQLAHPHILALYGAYGSQLLVCEHGSLLSAFVVHTPRPNCMLRVLRDVLHGLQFLHTRGFTHGAVDVQHMVVGDDLQGKLLAHYDYYSVNSGETESIDKRRVADEVQFATCMADVMDAMTERQYAVDDDVAFTTLFDETRVLLRSVARDASNKSVLLSSGAVRKIEMLADYEAQAFGPRTGLVVEPVADSMSLIEQLHTGGRSVAAIERQLNELSLATRENECLLEQLVSVFVDALKVTMAMSDTEPTAVTAEMRRLDRLYSALLDLLTQCAARTNVFYRIASSHHVLAEMQTLHDALGDRALRQCDDAGSVPAATDNDDDDDWATAWDELEAIREAQLATSLDAARSLTDVLPDRASQQEALLMLQYEQQQHTAEANVNELVTLALAKVTRWFPIERITSSRDSDNTVPVWFIPRYEVMLDPSRRETVNRLGTVLYGTWRQRGQSDARQRIRVKLLIINALGGARAHASFVRDVDCWYRLSNAAAAATGDETTVRKDEITRGGCDHVQKLLGACHVGPRAFLVLEDDDAHRNLREYVDRSMASPSNRKNHATTVWRLLHQAALGLAQLHAHGIVHGHLQCSNIVVGTDGTAKLSDFGFDAVRNEVEAARVTDGPRRSLQWSAPELLLNVGSQPTSNSDVYALGMCMLEAFSRGRPWGDLDNADVLAVIEKHELPSQPVGIPSRVWTLVTKMCTFEPTQRMQLTDVVAELARGDVRQSASSSRSSRVAASEQERSDPLLLDNDAFDQLGSAKVDTNVDVGRVHPTTRGRNCLTAAACCRCHGHLLKSRVHRLECFVESDTFVFRAIVDAQLVQPLARMFDALIAMQQQTRKNRTVVPTAFLQLLHVLADATCRLCDVVKRFSVESAVIQLMHYEKLAKRLYEVDVAIAALWESLPQQQQLDDGVELVARVATFEQLACADSNRSRVDFWRNVLLDSSAVAADAIVVEAVHWTLATRCAVCHALQRHRRLGTLDPMFARIQTSYLAVSAAYDDEHMDMIESNFISSLELVVDGFEIEDGTITQDALIGGNNVYRGEYSGAAVTVKRLVGMTQQSFNIDAQQDHELTIWRVLQHPHVLRFLGVTARNDTWFVVSESANIGLLPHLARTSENERWSLLLGAALGIAYVHTQGVVHADLRCSNIVVGRDRQAKVADFGRSFRVNGDGNRVDKHTAAAATHWCAPECITNEPQTFATDVYMFGMTIVEAWTGGPPFGANEPSAIASCIMNNKLPPTLDTLSSDVQVLVRAMCAFAPTDRITMADVVTRLKALKHKKALAVDEHAFKPSRRVVL